MKKTAIVTLLVFAFSLSYLRADEGMWLLSLVKKYNYDAMKRMGLQLTPEQIYDESNPSLKDAIVWFNGNCTGEIVSDNGLVLTNHHCGYTAIDNQSSVDHDYLKDGFWAMTMKDELPNPSMFVSILVRMEDVTPTVLEACSGLEGSDRDKAAAKAEKAIEAKATAGTGYTASVKEMFTGSEYYLFVFETFKDIRLVGAPPSSIGKFGGDTDNWMWPRHTCDFSMFRIYCGKDNKPAPYSADNVPYKPKKHLDISLKGYNNGDFAMIMGFPGRTNRYLSSYSIDLTLKEIYPAITPMFQKELEIEKKYMDADPKVDIMLASQYAQLANGYKLYQGQTGYGMADKLLKTKQDEENKFSAWANAQTNDSLRKMYTKVLPDMKKKYDEFHPSNLPSLYGGMMLSLGFAQLANTYTDLYTVLNTEPVDMAKRDSLIKHLKESTHDHFIKYYAPADKDITAAYLSFFNKGVAKDKQGTYISDILAKYKAGTPDEAFAKYADEIFSKSIFASEDKMNEFLAKPSAKELDKDPGYQFAVTTVRFVAQFPNRGALAAAVKGDNRIYTQGLRQMEDNKQFFPDANSTIRLTYGQVKDYNPRDAVHYNYYTTLTGVMQKENPASEEFIVPAKLKELYQKKDFGPYAVDGDVPVAFLANTDITGGNSGSPIMNAKGELLGLAFDGNSEAMTGDFYYDPTLKRTISVDIRYVLFIIDKYANDQRLINEMTISR